MLDALIFYVVLCVPAFAALALEHFLRGDEYWMSLAIASVAITAVCLILAHSQLLKRARKWSDRQ